ncbi:hypothetical protein ABZX99_02980 [Streptomyces antibioticus]|nr:hypothetical protein [Streptomyces sp. S9]
MQEHERTVQGALEGNARTARYIAIMLTRGLIVGGFAVLLIVGFVVWCQL